MRHGVESRRTSWQPIFYARSTCSLRVVPFLILSVGMSLDTESATLRNVARIQHEFIGSIEKHKPGEIPNIVQRKQTVQQINK